jgi:hypothetical protein
MLVASVVAILTCVTVANATQTITTPNAAFISYNLAIGASSAAITPAASRSVLVMGCCLNVATPGVGHVSLLHTSTSGIEWVGLESPSGGGSAITQGVSNTAGHHIVFIDFNHLVDIQVAGTVMILIHNGSVLARAGNVTLIW